MEDIQIIVKLLEQKGFPEIASLLKEEATESYIRESNNYGNFWHSTISTFVIKTTISSYLKLKKLDCDSRKNILEAIIDLYPHGDNSPEIVDIEFEIDRSNSATLISVNNLKDLSHEYLEQQIQKAKERIHKEDWEGAITTARTLVESVCKFILEEDNNDEDLPKLMKKTMKALNMNLEDFKDEEPLRNILSGFIQIVSGLANLRNVFGDAHGKGFKHQKRYKPTQKHALIAVNASYIVSDYLISSYRLFKNEAITDRELALIGREI